MQIINRMNQALGQGADERPLSAITRIVIHHSANPTNGNHLNTAGFENTWRSSAAMGAPNARGGYHEVVLFNGNVEINMQDQRRVWGARNQNDHTWHICLTGWNSGRTNNINQKQMNSLAKRIAEAMGRFGWRAEHVDRIVRHRDLPGQSTACNDVDLAKVRQAVRALLSATPPSSVGSNPTGFIAGDANADFRVATETLNVRRERNAISPIVRTLRRGEVIRVRWVLGVNGANPIDTPWGSINGSSTEFINMNFVERATEKARTHTVRAGETLWGLSQRFGVSVPQIQKANQMGSSNHLAVGQRLVIPS